MPQDRLDLIRRVLAPAKHKPARREAQLTTAILQFVASWRGLVALSAWAVGRIGNTARPACPIGKHDLWGELHAAMRAGDTARTYVRTSSKR